MTKVEVYLLLTHTLKLQYYERKNSKVQLVQDVLGWLQKYVYIRQNPLDIGYHKTVYHVSYSETFLFPKLSEQ